MHSCYRPCLAWRAPALNYVLKTLLIAAVAGVIGAGVVQLNNPSGLASAVALLQHKTLLLSYFWVCNVVLEWNLAQLLPYVVCAQQQ